MLIEHLLKRPNGSYHEIGGTEYHFCPGEDGAHVADVKEKAHADRFLSIPGFRRYDPKTVIADAEPKPVKAPPPDPVQDWPNTQLLAWAKKHKINPRSKASITDFARVERLDAPADEASPYLMLRRVASQYEAIKAGTYRNENAT